ncbi:hypothetical protein [Rhodococcus daqingensis]|uniref:Transcriptional regulator n=1 Tax=Rhodococcus daqingensis TaxID=2479363 RepID=A0ABW2RVK3_9NOCA
MRNRISPDSVLAEHAAALERIRAGFSDANLAADARSRRLRSAATVPEPPREEQERADGYPVSWLV